MLPSPNPQNTVVWLKIQDSTISRGSYPLDSEGFLLEEAISKVVDLSPWGMVGTILLRNILSTFFLSKTFQTLKQASLERDIRMLPFWPSGLKIPMIDSGWPFNWSLNNLGRRVFTFFLLAVAAGGEPTSFKEFLLVGVAGTLRGEISPSLETGIFIYSVGSIYLKI